MIAAIYARKSTDRTSPTKRSPSRGRSTTRAPSPRRKAGPSPTRTSTSTTASAARSSKSDPASAPARALPRPPFTRLIVSEQKSIGREMSETSYVIKQLAEAGVEIFEYVHGKSLTPKNCARQDDRPRPGLRRRRPSRGSRASACMSAHTAAQGGSCRRRARLRLPQQDVFNGVDRDGRPLRSHVERVIDETEAAVVRRIFELYDSGLGLEAHRQNAHAARAHRHRSTSDELTACARRSAGRRRRCAPCSRARPIAASSSGTKREAERLGQVGTDRPPESEWIRTTAEQLRIIDERVLEARRSRDARRPRARRCASRAAASRVARRSTRRRTCSPGWRRAASAAVGWLSRRAARSAAGCPNTSAIATGRTARARMRYGCSVAEMNEAVLQAIEEHALTPEAIEQVILFTERDDIAEQQDALERERKDIDKRIARLVAAIETGGDAASLVAKLRDVGSASAQPSTARWPALQPVPRLAPAVVENRLAEWRRLLRAVHDAGAHRAAAHPARPVDVHAPRNPISGD